MEVSQPVGHDLHAFDAYDRILAVGLLGMHMIAARSDTLLWRTTTRSLHLDRSRLRQILLFFLLGHTSNRNRFTERARLYEPLPIKRRKRSDIAFWPEVKEAP